MSRTLTFRNPPTDNDDIDDDSWTGSHGEHSAGVIIAEQSSEASSTMNATDLFASAVLFLEEKYPFLFHYSSYTLGVLLILCVTVIWVVSSNWIQYIYGDLNYNKPYFLTYFNTTGFSVWNLGYLLIPKWKTIPWDDRERPQHILVEDLDILTGNHDPDHEAGYARHSNSIMSGDGARLHYRCRGRGHAQYGAVGSVTPGSSGGSPGGGAGGAAGNSSVAGARGRAQVDQSDITGYTTDIRVWAANSGYDLPEFSSESPSVSDVSMEEIVDVGAVPALSSSAPAPCWARVERVRPYSRRTICFWAAVFCPFWFFANYLFNLSLSMTSVASNTVLSSTSSIWTLLLSYVLLHESVSMFKWLAVIFCVTGSVMVGISDRGGDSSGGKSTIGGDIVALISAFFYATYTSILRFGLPDDERYAIGMVFGAVGIINFIFLWPGLVFVDLAKWETFAWPSVGQFWPLALNALIGTNLSDVLWARSVVLTSPVVATLGLALTTPMAMIVDAIFKGSTFSAVYIGGAVLVMCGFVLVNL